MSWVDAYSHAWHTLNQGQVTRMEAEIKGGLPDIKEGELKLAIESLRQQDDAPSASELVENIRAIRSVGFRSASKGCTCEICMDKGTVYFPAWYRSDSWNLLGARDYLLCVGYDLPRSYEEKYGEMCWYNERVVNPCICEKGRTLMERWLRHGNAVDIKNLTDIAMLATDWIANVRALPSPEKIKNTMPAVMSGKVDRMAARKIDKPKRSEQLVFGDDELLLIDAPSNKSAKEEDEFDW